jgi:hypothetical protein
MEAICHPHKEKIIFNVERILDLKLAG